MLQTTISTVAALLLLCGCCVPTATHMLAQATSSGSELMPPASPTPPTPVTSAYTADTEGLSQEQVATLGSLEQMDEYPLYAMHYRGGYGAAALPTQTTGRQTILNTPSSGRVWACSLFAALADPDSKIFGRNFDWEFSPALVLFTSPPDGYASVSMVDIAYLGFGEGKASGLTDLPLIERQALLGAPLIPFDGMNEHGLAVGMAAVPPGDTPADPDKETISSLMVIREILDHARDVEEAVTILRSHNIDWSGGPHLHYLIADASGRAVLVEFHQGAIVVIPNETPWHQATNFLHAAADDSVKGYCWRYDTISERLGAAAGRITAHDAMDLLHDVAQDGTQWSVVYEMSTRNMSVVMGQTYRNVHAFAISRSGE
jgi:hypothetical protein